MLLFGIVGAHLLITSHASPTTHYVSRSGSNGDGSTWGTAWNELANINWSVVQPGDTIIIDGGSSECAPNYSFANHATSRPGLSCGMLYNTTLTVGKSGTSTAPITVRLSSEANHNGTAVFFGGRSTMLPYCHQTSYTATVVRQYGILVNSSYHDVIIDGNHTSGIMVYGAGQGVRVTSGSGASNLTFSRMEVFDNGTISSSSGGGSRSDAEGFSLGAGTNMTIRGSLIHDNGQDGIQDETRSAGTLNNLNFDTDWIYNHRDHPSHPGLAFNDLQVAGDDTCTHADSIQLYSGGSAESGLTVSNSIIGPLVNQGLYPGDSGTGAVWTNVKATNSLFLAISHNVISDLGMHGWVLDRNTYYAPQGGLELPSNGANTLTNSIKYGGYVYAPGWSGTASGNVWWTGDKLPGTATNANPNFTAVPAGPYPASYASYAAANFTPNCTGCVGSSIHKFADLLSAIGQLPAATDTSPTAPPPPPAVTPPPPPPPPTSGDTTAPTVSFRIPTSGQTISGSVPVEAVASDNVGVAKVEFYVDGALNNSEASSPYCMAGDNGTCFGWDTATVADGAHTLLAKAYDSAGNSSSASVNVTIKNTVSTADTTAPGIIVISPTPGQTVSGTVAISANATDNVGVVSMDIYIDGMKYASTSGDSLSTTWNTRKLRSGSTHTLVYHAKDAAGNTATRTISVTRR